MTLTIKEKAFLDESIAASEREVMKIVGTSDKTLAALENEAEAKTFWDNSKKLRDEFGKFETFRGYWAAMRAGLVSVYGFAKQRKKSA